jgi:FdrA protein
VLFRLENEIGGRLIVQTLIKLGEYRDSVALMLIARELTALPGVSDVSVVMGTPANKAVLQQAGMLTDSATTATPNDLLIVVQAKDDATARASLDKAQQLLAQKAALTEASGASRPHSIRSAIRASPDANVAVISVPGPYAAAQAWDALRAGLHVLLFSDHVALEDEIALKEYARDHGLLLMGPGAGTTIINGIGLGFANAVPRGNIGIVAAAGTGLQEVSTLIAQAGHGITHGIGVGGRDVSEAVGGIMLLEGLNMLQADPETRVIVVVSKLPAESVTEKIIARVSQSDKPTVLALFSNEKLQITDNKWYVAGDLREAAAIAAALARGEKVQAARRRLAAEDRALVAKARTLRRGLSARQRYVRGLYSGGTLCEEAMRIWQQALGEVWSNAPLDARFKLPDSNQSRQHTAIDLGEEEFTMGRPHPMIDNTLRVKHLLQQARDPNVAVIALDVVIGYGAHPDPASDIAPAIVEAKQIAVKRKRKLIVVTSVAGTENDLQGLSRQTDALRKAGAIVLGSNAAVAKFASFLVA